MQEIRTRVPLADPALDTAAECQRILMALKRVVENGSYILGPEVASFERALAERQGVAGAIGVGSGTDALMLALKALEIGAGDEVVTVSHTAGPTVAAIAALGATPVLVDVEEDTFCVDPETLDAAFSPRTKAVLVVHLYGHPADLDRIQAIARARGVPVVEDCAQAQDAVYRGRVVGSIGLLSCFSFYPTKNLGAIGDGGAILTSDAALLDRARQLRTYGWTKPQYAEVIGGRCSRLDEMQAAVLNVKLPSLADLVARRRAIAAHYSEAIRDLPLVLPVERPECRHAYHLYVIRSDRRDALARALDAAGISTGLHYPHPVHQQPAFAAVARVPERLNVTERLKGEILTLPLYPSLTADQQGRVIDAVRDFFGHR